MTHTTQDLSAEQIADGWALNDGKGPDDDKAFVQVYAPADGCELGQADDFDFSFPSADDHETDPIGSANNYFTRYRLLEPVRPSRPDQSLIASLTEALQPFASECEDSIGEGEDDTDRLRETLAARNLTVGDLRRARAALASAKGAN